MVKKRIKFIKGDFTSPLIGNVWEGREVTLNESTADRFISSGYAQEIADADATPTPAAELSLEDALKRLNPEDDAHWTKGGQPDVNVLCEILGRKITRKEVDAAFPDFNRDSAADEADDEESDEETEGEE